MAFEHQRPNQKIKAGDVRALARQSLRQKTGINEGDGAPGQLTETGAGRGQQSSDHGKTFYVRITRVLGTYGEKIGYEFEDVGIEYVDDEATTVKIEGGKIATPEVPAFAISDAEFAEGDYAIARRSWRSPYCWELFSGGGSSGAPGFWARLIAKSYNGTCPVYTCRHLIPSQTCASGWEETDITETVNEVNGVDLPVFDEREHSGSGSGGEAGVNHGTVVWVQRTSSTGDSESQSGSGGSGSDGTLMLFEQSPRWEIVEVTTEPDESGFYEGTMMRYDEGGGFVAVEEIYIVDANAI